MSSIATHARRIAVATLVATGAGLATTGAAQAAVSDCDRGRLCLWENANATGRTGEFATGVSNLATWAGGVLNDKSSYVANNSTRRWCVYEHSGYRGRYRTVDPSNHFPLNTTIGGFYWNDKVSSAKPC